MSDYNRLPDPLATGAAAWRAQVRTIAARDAEGLPLPPGVTASVAAGWLALRGGERVALASTMDCREQLVLYACANGLDLSRIPRAASAWATPEGVAIRLTDGRACVVPWLELGTAVLASPDEDRAAIEFVADGVALRWPATGSDVLVAWAADVAGIGAETPFRSSR